MKPCKHRKKSGTKAENKSKKKHFAYKNINENAFILNKQDCCGGRLERFGALENMSADEKETWEELRLVPKFTLLHYTSISK